MTAITSSAVGAGDPPPLGAPVPRPSSARRHTPWFLYVVGILVSIAVILPLVFLVIQGLQVGWSTLEPLLFRSLTARLVWNTVALVIVVTAVCAVIGTLTAWFVERTELPGRHFWAVAVVIPLGIPDFVTSFGWHAVFPNFGGFWAAVLIMSLAVYPLVYLPVAANLRNADPAQEEVARSLGHGRLTTFWRVTLGQARLAILGGSVLVGLVVLAEFGAFEILGYNTLTTEIYTEFQVAKVSTACAFSVILVILGALLLFAEGAARGKGRSARMGAGVARVARPRPLGRARPAVLAGVGSLVALALGVPVGAIAYLIIHPGASTLPSASLWDAAVHTFGYAATAGLLATAAALPIGLVSIRFPSRLARALERTNMLVLAMPGLVIALSFVYFTVHFLNSALYQTPTLLVITYAVMFFPLAVVSVRAGVARAPVGLEEIGHSLGVPHRSVFWRVTLPLLAPGLAAAFCLVFLEAATELTATLVLIPTNAHTLATRFWEYQTNLAYGQAAPYAGVMVLLAAVPSYVLGRFFDRLPSRTPTAQQPARATDRPVAPPILVSS
ncbi:MAG TPA: iron ABC transporter permease [Acidimicrobiales bacterium]|nr:iron ABC transporter permease [Acidimicrobiales bacterium]